MSLEVAADLVVCGVLLAGLSYLARHVQPDFQRVTLLAGLVGGGLCVVWGVLGRRMPACRGSAMVTLALLACVFVRQAVLSWRSATEDGSKSRMVVALMAVLVVFCIGTVGNLVREGTDHE
jgi:peptidoglycan/LPS O-acetylase OafA/YrhL